MSELVTAFFLSELATYSISERDYPLLYCVIPILILICFQVVISFLTVKIPIFKKAFDFAPSVLICEGKVIGKELAKNRLTLDELFSLLRLNGFYRLSTVRFAILEPNGQLSVVPFGKDETVTCSDLGLDGNTGGYTVAVVDDGKINQKALQAIGKDEKWLKKQLKSAGIKDEKTLLLMASDLNGEIITVKKDKS